MSVPSSTPAQPAITLSLALFAGIALAVTAVRLAGLHFSVVDFHRDEAQYWVWSQNFALGYFSKPPLLAWIMRGFEWACGNGMACVRAPAPLMWLGTALLTYAVAQELYDNAAIAFWSGIALLLGPAITFSSRVISTDVPLMLFWALALLAFLRLAKRPNSFWTVVLGVALGLGLLSKYAMIYFVMCVACAAIVDKDTRDLLRRPHLWIALAIAVVVLSPNVFWVVTNKFSTFRHTGENIFGSTQHLSVTRFLEFVNVQFAMLGPVIFVAYCIAVGMSFRGGLARADKLMLCFSLPILALIGTWAFLRVHHGNWTATAYIALPVLACALIVRRRLRGWMAVSVAIGLFVQAVLPVTDAVAYKLLLPVVNRDPYQRLLGTGELAAKAARLAGEAGTTAFATDDRAVAAALLYHLRERRPVVLSWRQSALPENYFEQTWPLTPRAPAPVLFVSPCARAARLAKGYGAVQPLGPITARTGPNTQRTYYAFKLALPRTPLLPLRPCG